MELAFTVFPQPSAFFPPGKGAFDDPAFGHDHKLVQFMAFDDVHRCPQHVWYCGGKRFPRIRAVGQRSQIRVQPNGATSPAAAGADREKDAPEAGGFVRGIVRDPLVLLNLCR